MNYKPGTTADESSEVTPEMIQAGVRLLREWEVSADYDDGNLVRRILLLATDRKAGGVSCKEVGGTRADLDDLRGLF